jgi:hypothetical protein
MAVDLISNVAEAIDLFAQVATSDPVSGGLLTLGAVLVTVSVAVLGWLSVGAVLGAIARYAEGSGPQA